MTKDSATNIIIFAGGLIVLPFYLLMYGWAIGLLWSWFVVPEFSVRELSMTTAIGLGMFIAFLTQRLPEDGDKTPEEKIRLFVERVIGAFIRPAMTVLLGWIVVQFA